MTPPRRPSPGFTLVELLAVIAITGVLAALVLVSVGRARDAAKSTRCVGNLRQMGPAFMAYAADHRGRYPLSYNSTGAASNNWWYHLAPYLALTVRNEWPSVKQACSPGGPLGCPDTDVNDTTYALPWVSYKMTRAHRNWLIAHGGGFSDGLPVANISNPARSLLVAEGRAHPDFATWTTGNAEAGLLYPHRNKLNALFADGHVETLSQQELGERWGTLYTRAVDG